MLEEGIVCQRLGSGLLCQCGRPYWRAEVIVCLERQGPVRVALWVEDGLTGGELGVGCFFAFGV